MLTSKSITFNKVLQSAKFALESTDIPFHLHSGTALGVHREKDFIQHDNDIDLAIFYKDADTREKLNKIKKAMKIAGFTLSITYGKLSDGFELKYIKNNVYLDIFWVYEGEYRKKKYFILSSYGSTCKEQCIWGYNPYKTVNKSFLGEKYNVIPKRTLVDLYGKNWKIPQIYDYNEGIEKGFYKGLIKDYNNPLPINEKIAFCFMLYDTVKHESIWKDFFLSDNHTFPSYNIYSHVKKISNKIPNWIKKRQIRTIKTGWCEENLVHVWINLLKTALKDPDNKYFALLSGECIPLFNYVETFKKIFKSPKSRINIDYDHHAFDMIGLYYADQWTILNRKHAELLIKLYSTTRGKQVKKEMYSKMCNEDNECFCPDEIYPINWFVYNYGKPSTNSFKKEFLTIPATYTYWDGDSSHPVRFNSVLLKKMKKKICKSQAIFARKFNNKAAKQIGLNC